MLGVRAHGRRLEVPVGGRSGQEGHRWARRNPLWALGLRREGGPEQVAGRRAPVGIQVVA